MATLLQDLRFALRTLLKSPAFTAVALLSLALGIGANTAIFSLMDQVLLRSLPVKHPEELVLLSTPGPKSGFVEANFDSDYSFSYPMYQDIRDRAPAFNGVLARYQVPLSMSWKGGTERVHGELVSGNFFDVLGVPAAIGRTFMADDDRTAGASPVAVLSHGFWTRRFAANPAILNQTISLNGHAMTVVGIAQQGFRGIGAGETTDVFVPMMMKAQMTPGWDGMKDRRAMWLMIMGRLQPGVSAKQAEVALTTFWRPLFEMELKEMKTESERFRKGFVNQRAELHPGQRGASTLQQQVSKPLIVLMAMVGLVLLIACANVANLLIARAAARRKEIAIRLALGAGRWRIVRQLLVESSLLAVAGGALGLLAASWACDLLIGYLPFDSAVESLSSGIDLRVLLFAFAVSAVTGVLFGLAPALQATRPDVAATLKDEAAGAMGSGGQVRLRKVLVVVQVGLSLLLLIGSGLFARSLYNLRQLNPGFRADHVMTFSLNPQLNGYGNARMIDLYGGLRDDLAALPGVRAASLGTIPLLSGDNMMSSISVEGYKAKDSDDNSPAEDYVGPGYLATLGIPLVAGREFTAADTANAPHVALVNQAFAQNYFAGENPLGRHFQLTRNKIPIEIVGVVKDGKYYSLREKTPRFMYFPYTQNGNIGPMTMYVRTAIEPSSLGPTLRKAVQRLDANLPVADMKSMQAQVDESVFLDRLTALLSGFFGLLATLLAAIGLYGVMAYTVARRTREIGIRMALGANTANVLRLVMAEVAIMAGLGIAIALPVSYPLTKLIESQLYGLQGNDPLILTLAAVSLAAVALVAGYIPAARAARVDPLIALRYE